MMTFGSSTTLTGDGEFEQHGVRRLRRSPHPVRTSLLVLPLNSTDSGTTEGHEIDGHPFWIGLGQARRTR